VRAAVRQAMSAVAHIDARIRNTVRCSWVT
jgi:hypothetical protein